MFASTRLPADPASAEASRRFVTVMLSDWPHDVIQVAALLTSELVTNAVVHARSAAEVVLDHSDRALRVAVTDESSHLPILVESMDLLIDHSRGLSMVSDMSDDWGVLTNGDSKTVWFNLRRPHRPRRRFGRRQSSTVR